MTNYDHFKELTDDLYTYCTIEQKLGLYIQHHPNRAVGFLLELLLQVHPELKEEENEQTPPTR